MLGFELLDEITVSGVLEWLNNWSNIIYGFGSLALSSVLAYLYRKQANISDKQRKISDSQTKIMKQQLELKELEYKPRLRVHNFEFESLEFGDECLMEIVNLGNGPAENMYLRTEVEVYFEGDSKEGWGKPVDDIDWESQNGSLRRLSSTQRPLNRDEQETFLTKSWEGGILAPNEPSTAFRANVQLQGTKKPESHPDRMFYLDELSTLLPELDVDQIILSGYILYTDVNSNIYAEQVYHYRVPLRGEEVKINEIEEHSVGHSTRPTEQVKNRVKKEDRYPPEINIGRKPSS